MFVFNRYELFKKTLACITIITLLLIGNVSASTIDSIQVLKIAPQDERAIIKLPDGKQQIIKPGDRILEDKSRVPGVELRVVEIAEGRVVLEEKTEAGMETVIIRLQDGKQRVERIKKTPEKQPQLYAPHVQQGKKVESKDPVKEKKKKERKKSNAN